jgi:hypothetical protein
LTSLGQGNGKLNLQIMKEKMRTHGAKGLRVTGFVEG